MDNIYQRYTKQMPFFKLLKKKYIYILYIVYILLIAINKYFTAAIDRDPNETIEPSADVLYNIHSCTLLYLTMTIKNCY
jgi:hypothetical protein